MATNTPETFHAQPADARKSIIVQREQKVARTNQIPEEILENEFLNSLISSSLPKNYNFEIHKTIWKIEQTNAKRVLLQLPEGLIRFGPILVDILSSFFSQNEQSNIKFITMGDLTYGACCIDDYLAKSMACDLIVHYAHSCLVPITQLSKKVNYLYIFLDIKFDIEHVFACIKHNFDPDTHNIALASTIQFLVSVHEIAKRLKEIGFKITLPQSRPLSSGEVIGCTAPKLSPEINTIVFVCDGRFHLEALMIANPSVESYRQRMDAIKKAVDVMENGGTFGFVLGTLGRQGSETVFDKMIEHLKSHSTCKFVRIMMPEVLQDNLEMIDSVDVWVQVACPRLSIDWGSYFKAPLLNTYEFSRSIKMYLGQSHEKDENSYAMDYYSKNSQFDLTPNHICSNNSNCDCSSIK